MRLEKITWVEMRRACMSSDEMSSDEMRKNQTLKRDVPGRRCQEIVAACCCMLLQSAEGLRTSYRHMFCPAL